MAFDEEHIDPHGECAAEIKRLRGSNAKLYAALRDLEQAAGAMLDCTDGSERECLREKAYEARDVLANTERA